jgi:hypothetical protein
VRRSNEPLHRCRIALGSLHNVFSNWANSVMLKKIKRKGLQRHRFDRLAMGFDRVAVNALKKPTFTPLQLRLLAASRELTLKHETFYL